jgi:hypothetical protein
MRTKQERKTHLLECVSKELKDIGVTSSQIEQVFDLHDKAMALAMGNNVPAIGLLGFGKMIRKTNIEPVTEFKELKSCLEFKLDLPLSKYLNIDNNVRLDNVFEKYQLQPSESKDYEDRNE